MHLPSALLKQVLHESDFETWTAIKKEYLPTEYHSVYSVISSHCSKFHKLPTFEDLNYEIRDSTTLDKINAIQSLEIEVEASALLEYLKASYAQEQILDSLEDYIDESIAFESAEESIGHLHDIVLAVEKKVDLQKPSENMEKMSLFEDEETLEKYISLGLNREYDYHMKFAPTDFILFGGKRGSGKSLTCSNIANNVYAEGKSAIYFTIEMNSRSILQRACAIGAGVPFNRLRVRNLQVSEWDKVAVWWADRFENSEEYIKDYALHKDFNKFHSKLTENCRLKPENQLDIIYDPELSVSRVEVELDKKIRTKNVGVIIVDYLNQLRLTSTLSKNGQYDWKEQIEVSKALKLLAQDYEVPLVSAYQIDSGGEARFSKGILDAADAAFVLNPYTSDDEAMGFECTKMRNAPETSFISKMDWTTLKMGPESAQITENSAETGEEVNEI